MKYDKYLKNICENGVILRRIEQERINLKSVALGVSHKDLPEDYYFKVLPLGKYLYVRYPSQQPGTALDYRVTKKTFCDLWLMVCEDSDLHSKSGESVMHEVLNYLRTTCKHLTELPGSWEFE